MKPNDVIEHTGEERILPSGEKVRCIATRFEVISIEAGIYGAFDPLIYFRMKRELKCVTLDEWLKYQPVTAPMPPE